MIFPPGWPAILALGFLARAPLAVGPLLAIPITLVTADLARHLARSTRAPAIPSPWQLAALFSVLSAALRYHTADTMSHGLAALCFATAMALIFRALDEARPSRRVVLAAGAGLAAGWLFATRPTSALALAIPLAYLLLRERALRLLPALAIGAIPGVALFLAHQHAATGAWLASSQRLYYAVSDGPPDCFRYGFGAGVGCVGEHGDFVRSRLADGYGFLAAAGTTLRRLKAHLVDPLNLEPLVLLVPLGAWVTRASTRGRALAIAIVAQIAAYAPFYFDGNYPAGGGRFLCDLLPIEHALTALAVVSLAGRWPAAILALTLAGFAFRAGFDHAQLRDRDGGRPFFEPAELARAGVSRGLVLIDSDHGFDLAHDPGPAGDLRFLRFHGDDLDALAWDALGRPPAHRHRFTIPPGGGRADVVIEPLALVPPLPDRALSFEGESLWPPLRQSAGWASRDWASGTCASAGRVLSVRSARDEEPASVALGLPAHALACRPVSPHITRSADAVGVVSLTVDGSLVGRWPLERSPGDPRADVTCDDLPPVVVPANTAKVVLTIERAHGSVALDRVTAGPRENHCGSAGSMRFP